MDAMATRKRKSWFPDDERFLKKALLADNRVLVYKTPPTLETIAAYSVVYRLWSHYDITELAKDANAVSPEPGWETYSSLYKMYAKIILKSVKELGLPKNLASGMRSLYIWPTHEELYHWAQYQYCEIFFHRANRDIAFKYANQLVWRYDGRIDYLETAKNMIKFCGELSDEERFRLMSVYCMEDEILEVLPTLLSADNFVAGTVETRPMICYWYNYVKGDLNGIREYSASAESRVMDSRKVNNIHAFKYFWSKLSREDRIRASISRMYADDEQYHQFVLSELDETEQRRLFREIPRIIIRNFASRVYSAKYVFSTWMFIRPSITGTHLVGIIIDLVRKGQPNGDDCVGELLCMIWDDSPLHLKEFVLNYDHFYVLRMLLDTRAISYSSSSPFRIFLVKAFSDTSPRVGRYLFGDPLKHYFWKELLMNHQPEVFRDWIKICGGGEEQAQELKNRILPPKVIEQRSRDLLSDGARDALNRFLRNCFDNDAAIADFKARLWTSDEVGRIFNWNLRVFPFARWAEMIDESSLDARAAAECKRKIAFSRAALRRIRSIITSEVFMKDIGDIFRYLIPAEYDQKAFKKLLSQYYARKSFDFIFQQFSIGGWIKFLNWTMDGEENVAKYKRKIRVDQVFLKLLHESIFIEYRVLLAHCRFREYCRFERLNDFLWWYCGTRERAKRFKLDKIQEYFKIDVINTLLKKKDISHLVEVLDWFFSSDKVEIEKFRRRFASSTIAAIAGECKLRHEFS